MNHFNTIMDVLMKLTAIVSNSDTVIIVSLIIGIVSIVGVIISSIITKIVDYCKSRQDYLTQKIEKPYGEFAEMIYKVQRNEKIQGIYSDKEMLEDLSKFSKQVTLCERRELLTNRLDLGKMVLTLKKQKITYFYRRNYE